LSMMNSMAPVSTTFTCLSRALEPGQDFVFDLQIPGVIIFAGLQHGARGRHRVAAALDFKRIEVRPVATCSPVELGADNVARLKSTNR